VYLELLIENDCVLRGNSETYGTSHLPIRVTMIAGLVYQAPRDTTTNIKAMCQSSYQEIRI